MSGQPSASGIRSFLVATGRKEGASTTRQGSQFIESESQVEGAEQSEDEGPSQENADDRDFLDDEPEEGESSLSFYREVDAVSAPGTVEPYFPLAFAAAEDTPTLFNFDMFLLDTLALKRHIQPSRESEEETPATAITFKEAGEAIEYCRHRFEAWSRPSIAEGESQATPTPARRLTHAGVDKWALFRQDGTRLTGALKSGDKAFDARLSQIRLDRFGNVMIWQAPQWSPASAQLTHGWPRRLTDQSHGGFLPGNMTVCAKATNLTLRRLAVCDVACLVSKATTEGAGLSRARLLNLRYAAIRHYRKASCPKYLISAMVDFGVNFATFEALSADALDALFASLTLAWRQAGDESSDSDSPLVEPLIPSSSFSDSVVKEIGVGELDESEGEGGGSATLSTLLARFSGAQDTSSDSEQDDAEMCDGAQPLSTAGGDRGPRAASRKRKRKSASVGAGTSKTRRTAEPAEQSTSAAGDRSSEPDSPAQLQTGDSDGWAGLLRDKRTPGLREEAFPTPEAWQAMLAFFAKHRPLDQEEIPCSSSSVTVQELPQSRQVDTVATRRRDLSERMAELFAICGERCVCNARGCLLKDGRFARATGCEQGRQTPPCESASACSVCSVFSQHLHLCELLAKASVSRGALFSRILAGSSAVHHLYALAVPAELPPDQRLSRKQSVKELLCSMLDCERNRLQCVRRVGELGTLVPQLLSVQLSDGRSLFWEQMRKVANTVRGQATEGAKRAALQAICERLPPASAWRALLTPPTL